MLKEKARPSYDVKFAASCKWCKCFQNHYSLCDVIASGESECRCGGDVKAAEERFGDPPIN